MSALLDPSSLARLVLLAWLVAVGIAARL